ncbi:uncharacterized protein LOC134229493 [Saccostrea cucullata]|uniref:uncharacterized protein LOC134229493 n=1 Tax=Saccostrea cuccullata TaxID=36930 RepID=UPI002ED31AC8
MLLIKRIAGLILGGPLLLQGICGTIINLDDLSEGICHKEELEIEISMRCDMKNLKINIVTDVLINCIFINNNKSFCHTADSVHYNHDKDSRIFTIRTPFNHSIHAGHTLWINTTCQERSLRERILLKPCLSGFRTTAYGNNTHVTISCEHASFRFSHKGMRIVGKEDLAHCRWNKENQTNHCFGDSEALVNGVRHTMPYNEGINITCKFDEQSVDINPHQQTTIKGSKMITKTNKLPSVYMSSQDNGKTIPTGSLILISILFIFFDIFV